MLKSLGAGAIGITGLSLADTITLARDAGFDAIGFDIREAAKLAEANGIDHVRSLFADAGIQPGHWNLPVNMRDDAQFATDLGALPGLAQVAVELGCLRATSGIMPGSNELTFAENYARTKDRFRQVAAPLAQAGVM